MAARIVVIDNEDSMRDLFTFRLTDAGYNVLPYRYSHIGLSALKYLGPALIILDFNMDDHGIGWEFLQLLKMDDATANVPILITSLAFTLPTEIQDYLSARHIQIVYKPFDLGSFLQIVQHTLKLPDQAGIIFSSDHILPILVVEDSEGLREAITTVLRFEHYEVATADNGLEALEAVTSAEYCLILLDIAMPIMTGHEFLQAYDQQLKPHTPVIILNGESGLLTSVLPSFVVDILPKPYEIKQLLTMVEKYAIRLAP